MKNKVLAVLAVVALASLRALAADLPQSNFILNDSWPLTWGTKTAYLYGSSVSNYLRIGTSSSDRFAVTASGLVGVGTNAPVSNLDVVGNVSLGTYAGVTAAPTNGMIGSGIWATGEAVPAATSQFEAGSTSAVRLKTNGWLNFHQAQVPTVTNGCGTSPSVVSGTDMAGDVTLGTSPGTSCTITFAETPINTPICTVHNRTSASHGIIVPLEGATDILISASTTLTAGDVIAWSCVGWE